MKCQAQSHGLSGTELGLVMGCYAFTEMIVTPFTCKIIPFLTVKRSVVLASLLYAFASTLMSLLPFISSPGYFLLASITLRLMSGIGGSIALSAAMVTIMTDFPDRVSIMIVSPYMKVV